MKKIILIYTLLILLVLLFTFRIFQGYIWINNLNILNYPILGLDVSNHQGDINWDLVKNDHFKFVVIKATEGKDFLDKNFEKNWEGAKRIGLTRGAYHFFTFKSSGIEQARHFINTVPKEPGCLPPAIDLEFGGNSKKIPLREELNKELQDFIREVRNHYGVEPIIYALYNSYQEYLTGRYQENPVWIRDILWHPKLKDGRDWVFWQYSNRGRVSGIKGFVDLNVFKGNEKEFRKVLLN